MTENLGLRELRLFGLVGLFELSEFKLPEFYCIFKLKRNMQPFNILQEVFSKFKWY